MLIELSGLKERVLEQVRRRHILAFYEETSPPVEPVLGRIRPKEITQSAEFYFKDMFLDRVTMTIATLIRESVRLSQGECLSRTQYRNQERLIIDKRLKFGRLYARDRHIAQPFKDGRTGSKAYWTPERREAFLERYEQQQKQLKAKDQTLPAEVLSESTKRGTHQSRRAPAVIARKLAAKELGVPKEHRRDQGLIKVLKEARKLKRERAREREPLPRAGHDDDCLCCVVPARRAEHARKTVDT